MAETFLAFGVHQSGACWETDGGGRLHITAKLIVSASFRLASEIPSAPRLVPSGRASLLLASALEKSCFMRALDLAGRAVGGAVGGLGVAGEEGHMPLETPGVSPKSSHIGVAGTVVLSQVRSRAVLGRKSRVMSDDESRKPSSMDEIRRTMTSLSSRIVCWGRKRTFRLAVHASHTSTAL